MRYVLVKDKPSLGDYAILKEEGEYDKLIWEGRDPPMTNRNMWKLIDILNEANPTDESAVNICVMILGKTTEVGDA